MLITSPNSFANAPILPPSLIEIERPSWLDVSHEKIQAARFITSETFLNSAAPFDEPSYKKIGYPFKAGKVLDTAPILDSYAYYEANGPSQFWYMRGWNLAPKHAYLEGLCEQYDDTVRTLYGPNKYLWHFFPDIQNMYPGNFQRSSLNPDFQIPGQEPYHVDNNMDHQETVQKLLEGIRQGGCQLMSGSKPVMLDDMPVQAMGIPLVFVTTISNPEHEGCMTDYETPFKSGNADIVHHIAERHRSPKIPIPCKRFFVQGVCRPIR